MTQFAVIRAMFTTMAVLPLAARAAVVNATWNSAAHVPVTAASYTATGNTVNLTLSFAPEVGTNLKIVDNIGLPFINGTFANLAQGQAVDLPFGGTTYRFIANYFGGTGNDLVLQWAATRAFAWGDNFSGGLGTGNTTNAYFPVPVNPTGALSGKTILSLAVGYGYSVALCSDGSLAAWGRNSNGQLGSGSTTDSLVPVAVNMTGALAGKRVVALSAGYDHCLALCSDGTAVSWGATSSNIPVAVPALAGKSFVAVSAGVYHSMALCSDGTVACWGNNDYGQLGKGDTEPSNVPVAVSQAGAFSGKQAISISAGEYSSFAVCSDGTPVSWGDGTWGVLGTGNYDRSYLPAAIPTSGALAGKTVAAISAGIRHTLALCTDGSLAGWGENGDGQLGFETPAYSSQPMIIPLSGALAGKTVKSLSAGYDFSFAVCSDGTVASWGSSSYSSLGDGSYQASKTPVAVLTKRLSRGESIMTATTSTYGVHRLALVASPIIPRISVEETAGTPVAKEVGTVILGNAASGTTISMALVVKNNGLAPLSISAASLEGPQAGDFSVSGASPTPIPAGGSMALTVSFSANAGFGHSARLRISSNDPYDGDYAFKIAATVRKTFEADYAATFDIPATASGFSLGGSSVHFNLNHPPVTGKNLIVLENTGLEFLSGTFGNLAQGQTVALSYGGVTYNYVANYYGGSGNDLVLQWAPNRLLAWGANSSGQLGIGNTTSSLIPVAVETSGILSGKTIISAAAGDLHSLALCSDGTLAAWGAGRLGNGSNTSSNVPVAAGVGGALAGKTVIAIAVGRSHNLALCSDGTLAAWGSNSNGVLGDGTTTSRNLPVAVDTTGALAGKRVIAIAAGEYQSLTLCSDGSVAAWGYNLYGNLGDGARVDSAVPVTVNFAGALAEKAIIAIASGNFHSLALCSDGTLVSWGSNAYGQLGDGSGSQWSKVPVAVSTTGALVGKTPVSIAAGDYMSAVLCSDSTLACWGYNNGGRLGNGSSVNSPLPVVVNTSGGLSGKTPAGLTTGSGQVIVPCSDGTLTCWGMNGSGQIGDNSTVSRSIAVLANTSNLANGEKFTSGVGRQGNSHSLGIVAIPYIPKIVVEQPAGTPIYNGNAVAFASSPPSGATSKTFTVSNKGIVPLSIGNVTITGPHASEFVIASPPAASIAPGDFSTLTVTFTTGAGFLRSAELHLASNDPYATDFQILLTAQGSGPLNAIYNNASDVPLAVPGLIATGSQVAFSLNFAPIPGTTLTVANVTGSGFIQGRFDNLSQGQEVILNYGGRPYKFVANYYGGTGNDIVLQWAGVRLFAWGRNALGQLGRGDITDSKTPAAVSTSGVLNGKVVLATATGRAHSLTLCSDGTIAAWGSNKSGQLGDGTTTDRTVPVAVDRSGALSGKTVISIAAGGDHSLALCSDGTLAAWGYGGSGVLGNGSGSGSSVPVAVTATGVLLSKTVVAIATGEYHSAAVCSDGTAVSWGLNSSSQLGNGNQTSSSVPVAVSTSGVLAGKSVMRVAAGATHTMVLCSDGMIAGWGYNVLGQLGNGNSVTTSTPSAVVSSGILAGRTVLSIAAGENHSLALCTDGTLAAWGYNTYGQLGNGTISSINNQPIAVNATGILNGNPPAAISAGYRDSLAALPDGSVATWGYNLYGQLGDGTTAIRTSPVRVARGARFPDERLITATTGSTSNHTLALAAYPCGPRLSVETQDNNLTLADEESAEIGKIVPGSYIVRTFIIRNPGDTDLTGLTISLDGAIEFSSGTAPATLDAGASSTIAVVFSPVTIGVRTATLHVSAGSSNASGDYDIHLTGIGLTNSEAWRLQYFQTIDNTGTAADSATPRNDGISNLMKFATGMDPSLPGNNPAALSGSGNSLTFVYQRSKAAVADGIGFSVEWSDDLADPAWSHSGIVEVSEDQGTTERVTATVPAGAGPHRFVRLRVNKP